MNIYLVRRITSTNEIKELDSLPDDLELFCQDIRNLGVSIVNPIETNIPKKCFKERFDFCIDNVLGADLLVVDARMRLGLGAGAEMMLANKNGIPILSLCPPGSYYKGELSYDRQATWTHPFMFGLSTKLFQSFTELLSYIENKVK